MKVCLNCNSGFHSKSWNCPNCGFEPEIENDFLVFAPKLDHNDTGYDESVYEELFGLEDNNFWYQSRNQLIEWSISNYFPEATRFMEIGCGTGIVLSHLSSKFCKLKCDGSEIHSQGLEFASTRLANSQLFQMDARSIPFREEYELIGAFDVLEHIEEDDKVLQQIHQALKPNGGVILTVPQHKWIWSPLDERACHVRRYTRRELIEKLESAGFKIQRATSFVSFLFPVMVISRVKKKVFRSRTDLESELRPPEHLNALFGKVMSLEIRTIRAGISLPFGGSLLVIAKKKDTAE